MVELPLVISDHADWDELTRTIEEVNPAESWITHGREEALLRWCQLHQRRRGRWRWSATRTRMTEWSASPPCVDALVYTRSRNEKLRLIADYLRDTPDPDRGWALAALTDGLDFPGGQGRDHPQPDDGAGRPGAVRAEPRFRRRYRRDRQPAVARARRAAPRRRRPSAKRSICSRG